jgi:hypothetical protein
MKTFLALAVGTPRFLWISTQVFLMIAMLRVEDAWDDMRRGWK